MGSNFYPNEILLVTKSTNNFQVTTQCPKDIEAWIELGGILQNSDVNEALKAYNTAAQIIRDNIHEDVPPEILNNIASCLFQLGKYEVNHYWLAAKIFIFVINSVIDRAKIQPF